MSVTTGISLNEKGIAQLSERLGEPAWMREKRLAAFKAYESLSLPKWDRTDLAGLNLGEPEIFPTDEGELRSDELPAVWQNVVAERGEQSNLLLQLDAGRTWNQLQADLSEQGVVVCDFATALREHEDLVKEYFGTVVPFDEDKLVALHYAAVSSGYFVYVPKNTAVEVPLELRSYSDREGLGLFPHILIVAEQGAEVTVIEGVGSKDSEAQRIVSEVVEICPKDGAQIRFGSVQDWGRETFNFTARRAVLSRDARVEWISGDFGARLSRSHTRSVMSGQGCESLSLGLFFGVDDQHMDIGTTMLHEGDHTSSDMVTKGVLSDKARVVYRGLTDIEHGARFTSAFQRENTMLLSEEARSDAIPGLEIDETEVQAGHAATVGQVDKVQLFYLMSRGLTRKSAMHLIVNGFFDPILQRVPIAGVQDELRRLVDGKMQG